MFTFEKLKLKNSSILFLGFDINKNSTGFSIIDNNLSLLYTEVFTDVSNISFESPEVLLKYNNYFFHIATEFKKYNGEIFVGIERPYSNLKTQDLSACLFRISGLCILNFYILTGRIIYQISPQSLKCFVTGYGHSPKEKVVECIENIFKLKKEPVNLIGKTSCAMGYKQDRADAISVSYYLSWSWYEIKHNCLRNSKKHSFNYDKRIKYANKQFE